MLSSKFFNSINRTKSLLTLFPRVPKNSRLKATSNDNDITKETEHKSEQVSNPNLGKMSTKYKLFREEDSVEILDMYEERNKYAGILEEDTETERHPFEGINLNRGIHGVFDIEDLVEVLKRENGRDIFVAEVPKDHKYVDYICLVTGKSAKHMQAMAQFVRKVYKQKRHSSDAIPKLEGESSKDWLALDLGNIALHIFSSDARVLYDLDSLWSIGPDFDRECNKQDPVAEMLINHSIYLRDLQPAP